MASKRTIGEEHIDAPIVLDGEGLPDVDVTTIEEPPAVQLAPTEVENVTDGDMTRTWGPFNDYTFVSTSWGEYGVPKGKVLFFNVEDVWDNKEKRFDRRPMPYYVNPGEPLVPVKPNLPNTIER